MGSGRPDGNVRENLNKEKKERWRWRNKSNNCKNEVFVGDKATEIREGGMRKGFVLVRKVNGEWNNHIFVLNHINRLVPESRLSGP